MKALPRCVLVPGSGAIRIGQAGEFDYSGSQALKALREEGVRTVLVNPNIATVQTSAGLADRVYFLPITAPVLERVIERERPDGILLGFGGQTALNVGLELWRSGCLARHGVTVLGTPPETIENTEDRARFALEMGRAGLKVPVSQAAASVDEALAAASAIGYPVMLRLAFALGGLGSGPAADPEALEAAVGRALRHGGQVLVEEYLGGWKEVEYEVVRDEHDNCAVVCSMENFDPMGIHTGESIVVAPVQTLSAAEHFLLRGVAVRAIRHLGVVGECNIQFCLDPAAGDYRIIEVNPRLSRSSALASKATGYPLAWVAARLALGRSLAELPNSVTRVTSACFEPALDYVVVKHPRWDLEKFRRVSAIIGSEMKSVGEVMSIARGFEEALQKAVRMLDAGPAGITAPGPAPADLDRALAEPTDKRLLAVTAALTAGRSVADIHRLTHINPWFLHRLRAVTELDASLAGRALADLSTDELADLKRAGFSDRQLAERLGDDEMTVRQHRLTLGVTPCVKQIDTTAGEFPARTNYLYLTYNGREDDVAWDAAGRVAVLGGGSYKIGSSVEFDWCCVGALRTLRALGKSPVMINCNPETVSTDYDECDRLYFEELTLERVLDICDKERPEGVIVCMGGQIPNNLSQPLARAGVRLLGTAPEDIDRAEDRHKFSRLLDELEVGQPPWRELTSLDDAEAFARDVGYPVLVRPSYVLSGAAMGTALTPAELRRYLEGAARVGREHPVVISKFIEGAKELEADGVARHGEIIALAVSEHIENAGVHSGDATLVLPPQRTYLGTLRQVRQVARRVAAALRIHGPFNIQFIARDNEVLVIECNLRASRSFPFVSKVLRHDLADLATRVLVGAPVTPLDRSALELDYVGVKAPQFSFTRLKGSDPVTGVEMASTGEVACLGDDVHEALLKSMEAVGYEAVTPTALLSTGPLKEKIEFLAGIRQLRDLGFDLLATDGTARFLAGHGIPSEAVRWPSEEAEPNALTLIASGRVGLVINIPKDHSREELDNDYRIRRAAVDANVPLITNLKVARAWVAALARWRGREWPVRAWDEYR